MTIRRYWINAAIFIIFLLILSHVSFLNASDINGMPRISADQVKQLLGNPETVIIDVRKSRTWWRSSKMILTAVREEPSRVAEWTSKYTLNQTLIFYCA